MKPPVGLGGGMPAEAPQQPQPVQPIPQMGSSQPQQGGATVRRASPEEQQLYNQFVGLSMTLLYDKKFMQTAIDTIRKENTVMEGVAKVSAMVAFRVYSDGREKGKEIPASVVVHAGMEVITLVAEMAMAAGFEPMTEQETELAYYGAADQFREMLEKGGMVDPAQMEADKAELEAMQKDGRLAEIMQQIQAGQAEMAGPAMPKGLG